MEPTNTNPNVAPAQPERSPSSASNERLPVAPEAAPAAPQGAPVAPPAAATPPVPPLPPAQAPDQPAPQQAATPAPNTNPAVAGDVDVIEKEWVDQANKVIQQTQEDPYAEEEAVESLQQDYLKKRYGHDVKKPDQTS